MTDKRQNTRDIRKIDIRGRAETTGGFDWNKTVAELNAASFTNFTVFSPVAFATDGRKVGEGAGSGTGCPVYFNPSDSSWRRFSDDTVVAI